MIDAILEKGAAADERRIAMTMIEIAMTRMTVRTGTATTKTTAESGTVMTVAVLIVILKIPRRKISLTILMSDAILENGAAADERRIATTTTETATTKTTVRTGIP